MEASDILLNDKTFINSKKAKKKTDAEWCELLQSKGCEVDRKFTVGAIVKIDNILLSCGFTQEERLSIQNVILNIVHNK